MDYNAVCDCHFTQLASPRLPLSLEVQGLLIMTVWKVEVDGN